MPVLDMFTVLFGQTLISAICALVAYLLWRNNRGRYDGIGFWFADYVLQTTCVGLIMLRGHIPDFISIVAANGLGMTGMLLLYEGLRRFFGLRGGPDKANLAVLLFFLGGMHYYGVVSPSLQHRNLIFNLALFYFCARSAWFLARELPAELSRLAWATTHSLLAFCAVCLARLVYGFFGNPGADFMLSRSPDAYFILAYSALLVMLTHGLFLLVNRRLLADTREDYEGRMEAEEALAGALKTAKLGTWRWDIKTGKVHWSEEMYSIFGLDRARFSGDLGAVIAAAIHPEDRAAVEASNGRVMREGLPQPLDYRVIRPDGGVRWVHAEASELLRDGDGLPAALKGYAQDITERKASEENARNGAARLELALRSAGMGAWYWDIKENRRHFDEQVCRLLGIDHASFGGTAEEFFAAVHPEDRGRIKKMLEKVVESEGQYATEYRAVWKDGSEHHISARGVLRRDEAGRPWRIDGIIWDVTEMKRAEAAIQTAQRLESLGTLAGGIAHDFNNLLTGITGNLSLIRANAAAGRDIGELTLEAEEACAAARTLARQLLTFSTGGAPVKTAVDLAVVAREAIAFSLRGSGTKHSFSGAEGLAVLGDKEQLFQVFQNLALNASQAMAGGGEVRVSFRAEAGRYAAAEVSDSGGGMSPEVLRRVFEPYFSTKGQGRGLGLAVCRSVVEKHGGSIEAASVPGGGSVFTVRLPMTDEKPALESRPQEGAVLRTGSGRVLIMDDEEVVWKALKRMLGAMGYEAEVAGDGEAALAAWEAAEKSGRPFGAAIMDLTIPGGIGGAEAVKLLKGKFPGAKVVVSSGYAEDPVMADYAARGFDGALSKPYRIEDLGAVMEKLLR